MLDSARGQGWARPSRAKRATPLTQNWAEEMARETLRQETAILTALEVWEQNIWKPTSAAPMRDAHARWVADTDRLPAPKGLRSAISLTWRAPGCPSLYYELVKAVPDHEGPPPCGGMWVELDGRMRPAESLSPEERDRAMGFHPPTQEGYEFARDVIRDALAHAREKKNGKQA